MKNSKFKIVVLCAICMSIFVGCGFVNTGKRGSLNCRELSSEHKDCTLCAKESAIMENEKDNTEDILVTSSTIEDDTFDSVSAQNPHEHKYILTDTVEAQIGIAGHQTYICICGDSYEEIIESLPVPTPPPHEHSYKVTNVLDAQIGAAGSKTYTCECGKCYTETIPALPEPTPEVNYGGWHQDDYASQVFNKINEVRVNNGLFELPWSDADKWLAEIRAEELVNEVATNTVHAGIKNYDRYVGEIAACGYAPDEVVDAWMNSSGHANQILADYNTSMAIGIYYDEYTAMNYYIIIFR